MSGPAARHTGQAHVKPSVCSFSWEDANNANDLLARQSPAAAAVVCEHLYRRGTVHLLMGYP